MPVDRHTPQKNTRSHPCPLTQHSVLSTIISTGQNFLVLVHYMYNSRYFNYVARATPSRKVVAAAPFRMENW